MRLALIVNARSGPRHRRQAPEAADAFARRVLAPYGVRVDCGHILHPGHGRELARDAVSAGADVVCAWGGDGTVNEVAIGVSSAGGVLGIVPAGSGNGFARDLGIPLRPDAALRVAVAGTIRQVDVGCANGRAFVATAGLGFDAHVTTVFARRSGHRRGVGGYVLAGLREAWRYRPFPCRVELDGAEVHAGVALLVAVANTRQWGYDARVAPAARPDDGLLDVVLIPGRSPAAIAPQVWRLWTGSIGSIGGVETFRGRAVTITANEAVPHHVDGEPAGLATTLQASLSPLALSVRVPQAGR